MMVFGKRACPFIYCWALVGGAILNFISSMCLHRQATMTTSSLSEHRGGDCKVMPPLLSTSGHQLKNVRGS